MAVLEEVEATASVGRAAVTLLPPQTAPARPNAAFDVYQVLPKLWAVKREDAGKGTS